MKRNVSPRRQSAANRGAKRGPHKSKRKPRTTAAKQRRRSTPHKTKPAIRWNPESDDVQRSVIKLVLTLVELIRKLMERQAIRRMEERTLSAAEIEAVGAALMEIERTIRDLGTQFDLTPEDLNLDLGTLKLL